MSTFKVIIVGGSIAGLTLANILERYGIDYVVLEKHALIAPQLGASIGLLPHGERILDQLGIFARVEKMSMPMEEVQMQGPDGLPMKAPDLFGPTLRQLLGYPFRFLDRQQLLQILFDSIHDKSKIQISREVFKIEHLDGRVQVELKDGSRIHGDLVVGADGVHSRVRDEIWRIAESEMTGYNSLQMSKSMACTYRCLFGITKRPPTVSADASFKTFHKGRSYLCTSGPDNKMYLFGFFKNDDVTTHKEIPRYTAAEADSLIAEYADDPLFQGLTFGDVGKEHTSMTLVPLEEYVLEKSFYKRAVLVGDSFHKMNPLAGQGGNSAIESAASLADLLKSELNQSPQLDDQTINRIFTTYQETRRERTTLLMESTKQMQQMEVLDNPWLEFLQLKVLRIMNEQHIGPGLAASSTPGLSLKHLPPTYKKGIVLPNEEVRVKPQSRSPIATRFWAGLMLLLAAMSPILSYFLELRDIPDSGDSSALRFYIAIPTLAISAFWVVESYRPSLLFSPLLSATPYILASTLWGWQVVLPVYFALHIFSSGESAFYYPLPRAINLWIAKALPFTMLFAFLATFVQFRMQPEDVGGWLMPLVHVSLPILLYAGKKLYPGLLSGPPSFQLLFGTEDMRYLSRLFAMICLFTSTAHLVFFSKMWELFGFSSLNLQIALTPGWLQLGCLTLAVIVWCSFVVWDMRRVNLTQASPVLALLGAAIACIFLGPAAVLAALWRWREPVLERGRQKA